MVASDAPHREAGVYGHCDRAACRRAMVRTCGRWHRMRLGTGSGLGATASGGVFLALQGDWKFDPNPERASEVEVRFFAADSGTRVELEHRNLERHGAGWEQVRTGVDSPAGWSAILEQFAKALAA